MKRVLDWAPVVIGIALLSTLAALHWQRIVHGQNDFVALYAGGTLAGTPELYSQPANEALIGSILGVTMQSVIYTRPPFYAVLLKPLTWLPYLAAYAVFCALCLGSILWFVIRFSKDCPALPLFASFSIPIAALFLQGQDTPFLLAFLGASILLARQKRDFLAGLVLSLCAIKFHLFLFVPLLLLLKNRWRTLAGAASGTGILLLLGSAVAGVKSNGQYVQALRNPWINFSTDMMPNIHGLVNTLHASGPLEIAISCAVVLAFVWTCRKTENYEWLLALSLLCGLLVSYHSGIGDDILLLPVFVLMIASEYKSLRIALAAALSPLPYFSGLPISIAIPCLLLLVLALAVVSVSFRSRALASGVAAA
jgi:hypothetical protein